MCLELNKWYHKIPRISYKPIKVYKIVCIRNHSIVSWFRNYKIDLNTVTKPKGNYIKSLIKGFISGYLEEGFIHYYTSEETATEGENPYWVILEAYIPRFTLYMIGDYNEGAARRLIVTSTKVIG